MSVPDKVLGFVLLWLIAIAALAQEADLHQRFSEAQFNFDRALAETLLPEFKQVAQSGNSQNLWLNFATAALLVAELRRGDYEHQSLDKKARRQLGRDIDDTAKAGLASLQSLPESSERYRLEADLLGTMIRSKFKGMKYQPRLEKAIARALGLDENNANAWVSHARRPLFAPSNQGGDPALALEYLDRAIKLDPEHVQALLFRGAAQAKLGKPTLADADWSRATKLNPNTAEARDRLLEIEMPQPPEREHTR
jgi:tetratricopeptide (TPR) repeat protein